MGAMRAQGEVMSIIERYRDAKIVYGEWKFEAERPPLNAIRFDCEGKK